MEVRTVSAQKCVGSHTGGRSCMGGAWLWRRGSKGKRSWSFSCGLQLASSLLSLL